MDDGDLDRALLRCEACGQSTAVSMSRTEGRCIVPCKTCGASIYWHQCERCGLRYVGHATASCVVCDAEDLDELEVE